MVERIQTLVFHRLDARCAGQSEVDLASSSEHDQAGGPVGIVRALVGEMQADQYVGDSSWPLVVADELCGARANELNVEIGERIAAVATCPRARLGDSHDLLARVGEGKDPTEQVAGIFHQE